jgi:DNA-binding XRE family transcriptional regulator
MFEQRHAAARPSTPADWGSGHTDQHDAEGSRRDSYMHHREAVNPPTEAIMEGAAMTRMRGGGLDAELTGDRVRPCWDPAIDADVRALLAETAEVRQMFSLTIPLAQKVLGDIVICVWEGWLERSLGRGAEMEILALLYALNGAREFYVTEIGFDPFTDFRGRVLTTLRRIRAELSHANCDRNDAHRARHAPYETPVHRATVEAMTDDARARRIQTVAANITRYREAREMPKNELARQVGVDRSLVLRWENGVQEPKPHHLEKLAEIFDVELHDFYRQEVAAA